MSANELPIGFVNAAEVAAAGVVLPAVEIVVVAWRFKVRYSTRSSIGIDDWLILAALLFSIGMGIALIYGVAKEVLGYPTPTPPDLGPMTELIYASDEQRLTELLDWITWILMIPANGLIKLSAICMYRRIFVVHGGGVFSVITIALGVICFMWTIAFEFATIFGCGTNVDYAWSPLVYIASCNTNMRLDGLMISDLITDIFVWVLPIPMVWSLNMKTSRKASVSGIFLLAAVSLAAAVVRLIVQEQISNGGYAAHTDVNLTLTTLLYWSNIETGLALIAACLPTMQIVLTRAAFSHVFSSLRSYMRLSFSSSKHDNTTVQVKEESLDTSSHTLTNASRREAYEHQGYARIERGHDRRDPYIGSAPDKAEQTLGINSSDPRMPV